MSKSLKAKVTAIRSVNPSGNLTPVGGNGYAKDELGRVYKFQTLEQIEAHKRRKQREQDQRHFSFSHMQNMTEVTRNLSNKYCGYILLLQPHIEYKTGRLVNPGRDPKPLKITDIARIWSVSRRTALVVVDELQARSILFETDGTYSINERYHFRDKAGTEVDALIKTFFTTLRRVKLTAADLGFVYKLLPQVHYDTNVICSDAFANTPEDVRFLSEKQIASIVGMSESKTRDALRRLRKAGVTGEWVRGDGDDRETLTVLNPYVFYRKAGEPDGTLRTLFAAQRFDAA